ncbi:MAG: hypothetical protein CG437_1492 [Methanosaeta sp. NSP1]|nr:MAG: hypothetical protein CG437_1492 [Methanosaeta sp. NSP1]
MRVRAHNDISGQDMPHLRHNLMAHPAEDIIIEYGLLLREFSQQYMILRRLEAVCGHLMIEEHDDPGRIPYLPLPARNFIKALDRQRSSYIVDHGRIDLGHDEFAGTYLFLGGFREYLLRQGLAAHVKGHLIQDK